MERPERFPKKLWDDLTDAEKKCIDEGGHSWYYDTCSCCGARKQVPDHLSAKRDEESRQLRDELKLSDR